MRLSKAFLKTYKEAPKEAEVVSHQLMLRASMIRQLTRGVYNYLPFGFRVLKKIENIVREEMDKAGAQEILMPVLQPASLWEESGRWFAYGPELMRLKDRSEREFALGPTHEEVVTDIVRNTIDSYKNLPINLYQIQTKFRDEMRPRFGLMRGREFVMKDAYSFHLTDKSLDEEYKNMKETYCRILERCGLVFRAVEADTGSIGGDSSHEFMVLAESGEDDILYSENSDYAANVEKASSIIELVESTEDKLPKELLFTPNCKTIEEVAKFCNVPESKTVKALLLKEVLEDKTNYFLVLIRGDLNVNMEDLYYDIIGNIREAREGDMAPDQSGTLKIARGIEVGHIFKLGDKYSKALNATVLDENGKQKIVKMGCYGMGVSRIMSAAIEQNNDEFGIIWPKAIAPYIANVIIANMKDETQVNVAEKIYNELKEAGIDVVLDDRNERAGFKFKDADLIGFPLKIVAGKNSVDGIVEIKDRKTGESVEVKTENVLSFVKEFLNK